MGFGKLWKLIMQFTRTWNVFNREVFQNGYGKFWILYGKILKYPQIDIT